MSTGRAGARLERRSAGFWVTAAIGWAVIGWALWHIGGARADTRPAQLARFVVGGIVVHDLVVVPVALAAGLLLRRLAPGRSRRWLQAALFSAAVTALFAYPLVRGFGHRLQNPTSLPRNYTAALAAVIAAVWLLLAAAALGRAAWARARRRR